MMMDNPLPRYDRLDPVDWEVLDAIFDGVYVMDRSRKIIFWNRGAEQITGFLRQDIVGQKCQDVPLNHLNEAGCQLCQEHCPAAKVIETGESEMAVVYTHLAEGGVMPVETHICPLHNHQDQIIGAIEIFRDVSNWKRLEDLTLEKSRLMNILAHDIRNPMTVVQTYGKILAQEKSSHCREIAGALLRQSQYVLALVDHLLSANTLEQKFNRLNIQSLEVEDALNQCLQNHAQTAKNKHITLVLENESPGLHFEMDLDYFTEIMNNLIANAIQYSFAGSLVKVKIQARPHDVEIQVCDQGIGIKEEEQDQLFRFFGKTSNRPTGGEKSFGLGLFIVKKLVDMFKGAISLESTPGQGTTVSLTLPLKSQVPVPMDPVRPDAQSDIS